MPEFEKIQAARTGRIEAARGPAREAQQAALFQDRRPSAVQLRRFAAMANASPRQQALRAEIAPVQRVINIGTASAMTTYDKPHGAATGALIERVDAALEAAGKILKAGWKGTLRDWARPAAAHDFPDETHLLTALEGLFPATKGKKRKADIDQQDQDIVALTSGADAAKTKRAELLSDNSGKAMARLLEDVSSQQETTATSAELELLGPGTMSTVSDVTTASPLHFLSALATSADAGNINRMDFNFSGTEVQTHGFESQGNRALAPSGSYTTAKGGTKPFFPFNLNTVKIGNNIGSYAKHQNAAPATLQSAPFTALNTLEKVRLPSLAIGTSIKRDLQQQGHFSTQEAIGQNHPHASVEFLGATSGSGLNAQQVAHMREQQALSNVNILATALATVPDQELGSVTADGKARTTPRAISDKLDAVMGSDADDLATKRTKKRELRRSLKRAVASTEKLEGINSDDDVSDDGLV